MTKMFKADVRAKLDVIVCLRNRSGACGQCGVIVPWKGGFNSVTQIDQCILLQRQYDP